MYHASKHDDDDVTSLTTFWLALTCVAHRQAWCGHPGQGCFLSNGAATRSYWSIAVEVRGGEERSVFEAVEHLAEGGECTVADVE